MARDVEITIGEATLSLEITSREESSLTNISIGIDALTVTLTHVDPEELLELAHALREWASARQNG